LSEAAKPGGSYTKAQRHDNSVGLRLSHCGKPPHSAKTRPKIAARGAAAFRGRRAATIFLGKLNAILDTEPK
jgi:hypothetical protein